MERALRNVSRFFNDQYALAIRGWLECIDRMPRGSALVRHVGIAPSREEIEDHLAEAKYALVFAGLGFEVEIEPFGSEGPDLRVSRDGCSAIVEIMRFRKVFPGPPEMDLADLNAVSDDYELGCYGDAARDCRKAYQKIVSKFAQTEHGESVIAIWNDDGDLRDMHVLTAVHDIQDDAARGALSPPEGLLFVLYGSEWVRIPDRTQLYCFPLRIKSQPHQVAWQKELASHTVHQLIQTALGE